MPKGDNSRKLTEEETLYIKIRVGKGVCMAALARKFSVSRQRVWQIGRGYRRLEAVRGLYDVGEL